MKRFSVFLLGILLSGSVFAHTFDQACNFQGRVKFTCGDFSDHGNQYVKIHISTGVWGNGTSDTLFKISPSFAFVVFVPQVNPNATVAVTFINTNATGSVVGETHVINTNNCLSLPLKFGDLRLTDLGNGSVRVDVTVYDVENVTKIKINHSIDGKHFETLDIILPENVVENRTYSTILKLN